LRVAAFLVALVAAGVIAGGSFGSQTAPPGASHAAPARKCVQWKKVHGKVVCVRRAKANAKPKPKPKPKPKKKPKPGKAGGVRGAGLGVTKGRPNLTG
jgi:hypothetical protein